MECNMPSVPGLHYLPVQFGSVEQLCPTLCNPMDCRTPGLPVHHRLPEFTQTHVHWVSDTIQPSHPLSSPSPPALNLSQHHGLFKWVTSLHQAAKVLEFQLQHQSFQWIIILQLKFKNSLQKEKKTNIYLVYYNGKYYKHWETKVFFFFPWLVINLSEVV